MLTLHTALRIPAHVSFTVTGNDAFLLNTKTNKYYGLGEVGARFWKLLSANESLQDAHRILLNEYRVESAELEKDLLELIAQLLENGLVELAEI